MLLRTLVLAGVAGTVGFAAGRVTENEPARDEVATRAVNDAASPPVEARPRPVVAPPVTTDDDGHASADDSTDETGDDGGDAGEDGGEDVGEVLAAAGEHAEALRRERNAIVGKVADRQAGEPLVGATVIATSGALPNDQVAITDESGNYELTGLPTGSYTLTFYYNDMTETRDGVVVSAVGVTRDLELFDTSRLPSISFTGTEDMENMYIVDTVDTVDVTGGD